MVSRSVYINLKSFSFFYSLVTTTFVTLDSLKVLPTFCGLVFKVWGYLRLVPLILTLICVDPLVDFWSGLSFNNFRGSLFCD